MELGSFADWLSAVGGVLAVIAAVIAWQVSRRMLEVEQRRDAEADRKATREQAELIFALGAKFTDGETSAWSIYLFNGSAKPIYDVHVTSQRVDGSGPNPPLRLGAVPPGRFVIPSHPTYHWGSLIDLDRCTDQIDFMVRGKGNQMITCVEFADAARRSWRLDNGTGLTVTEN